jgi:DNA-binding CsgD family transcriptional regulator
MSKTEVTYDVFVSHSMDDAEAARCVTDRLPEARFSVFLSDTAESSSPAQILNDVVWDALAESEALIVLVSSSPPGIGAGFVIGAASAWNKPVYVVYDAPRQPTVSRMIEGYPHYSLSQFSDVISAIRDGQDPLARRELATLAALYCEMGTPTDQLTREPDTLRELTERFNFKTGRTLSAEHLLREMLRLRKSGNWPILKRTARLTDRQRDILYLTVEGKTTSEISAALGVSARTVEQHRKHLREKLGVSRIAELTQYAP